MNNRQILANVKAGFISKHSSLNKWCIENGVRQQNAYKALIGTWKGKRGLEIRQILIDASGAQVYTLEAESVNQRCKPEGMVYTSQIIENKG